jgi:hypothetical protein
VKRPRETLAFLLLLILGLAPRLVVVSRFPTIPVSDFHNLIYFGLQLRDGGLTSNVPWFWEGFNVGLPLVLCGLFKILPKHDPAAVARLATVLVNGLLPLLPFFIWRGVLSLRLRVLAGAALALWPGQMFFSGVVAQDNWVLFPSIALAALAVRALVNEDRAWPVTAGLLYAAATAMRADMLLILPLLLAAVRVDLFRARWRQVIAGGLAAGLGLLGLASYRQAASGRFSLAPEFGGLAILGSYLPGSSVTGWEPPYAFLAASRPDLLRDRKAMLSETSGLGIREALRRPAFHALRIVSMMGSYAINSESANLYSSLEAPGVLPPAIQERGARLAARLKLPLRIEMSVIQALFLAALIVGIGRRNRPILALSAAVLLKLGFHAFGVFQGRYFIAATGLEILTIAVAVEEVLRAGLPGRRSLLARALAVGAALGLGLWIFTPRLMAFVQSRDSDPRQHTYHFFLETPDQLEPPEVWRDTWPANRDTQLNCMVDRGVLVALWPGASATMRTLQRDPAPGDRAVAVCELTGQGEPRPLILQVLDPYAPGGLGGRMVQRVEVDGAEVFSHDIAEEPWSGWADIPLGNVGTGTKRRVVIEVKALSPDPGTGWGDYARTTFQLVRSSPASNLAVGKPASQSSTLAGYATTGAGGAVDGKTDGNFGGGSVTATNRDTNAWWQVDLLVSTPIGSVVIWNRTDCCSERLEDYWVFVSDTPFRPTDTPATLKSRAGTWSSHQTSAPQPSTKITATRAPGRYVRVQLAGTNYLSLAEVQVFGGDQ